MTPVRIAFTLSAVAGIAAAAGLPLHAFLDDQRARIDANDREIARLRQQVAVLPSRALLIAYQARADADLATITTLVRRQRERPVILQAMIDAAIHTGTDIVSFREDDGSVVICGYNRDNADISEMLRRWQRIPGVTDVHIEFIQREWHQWCYDAAPPGRYGFLAAATVESGRDYP